MRKTRFQIQVTREAGKVDRCHVSPIHGQYNIAEHSYGAVSLLLLLHTHPSLDLIKAVMWHDLAERWLGDLPSTAKMLSPELKKVYGELERRILATVGLYPGLMPDEVKWLRAVDSLDLWLWSREQRALGNTTVQGLLQNIENVIYDAAEEFPKPAWDFFVDTLNSPIKRISDFFDVAVKDGLGETFS